MVKPIVKRCAGLDIHRRVVVGTILIEQPDETLYEETKEFGTFRKGRKELAEWLKTNQIELTVMESTGIYYKCIYRDLEAADLTLHVVNARYVKNVPGRKTDVKDSQWLASLARFGLLKPGFVPSQDLRELRLIARYRQKVRNTLSAEKNRLHKILDDAGIRLGCVVSDINGISARLIIDGLIKGQPLLTLLNHAKGRLKNKKEELRESLEGELSDRHRFLLKGINDHIDYLEKKLSELDQQLLEAMNPYKNEWKILQTIPGVDQISAALLITEIGVDMSQFNKGQHLASWAGMCPDNNESAGKKKRGPKHKGSPMLRKILCEAAQSARRTNSQFKGMFEGLVIRRGYKRSIVAVGHKILRVIFAMLSKNEHYQDPSIDYEALHVHKNAPRWLRTLKKFGYLSPEPA